MDSTSATLLMRLADSEDEHAWNRFVEVYAPFLFHWARSKGIQQEDAADLVQEVMAVLLKKMPTFRYDPSKSFRAWLKTITVNRANNFHRAANAHPKVGIDSALGREAIEATATDLFEVQEYNSYISQRMLSIIQNEFSEQVWQAFKLQVLDDLPAQDVAAKLGISVNSTYLAKSRVLRKLRAEIQDLIE